jgi:iron(III) transport system substrate-binding protein
MRKIQMLLLVTALLMLLAVASAPALAQNAGVVNVYSARHYGAMEATFAKFTEETGIEVRLSQGTVQALLQRLEAEGTQTPADVFFSIDAGGLDLAAEKGLLQSVESAVLTEAIPEDLRDPDGYWFALSQRFRTLMVSTERVEAGAVTSYAGLADSQWKGRLCLRPATHIYTISLTASLIAEYGEADAEAIVAGWVANEPEYIDSDSRILETIAAGGCDVALTNSYYLGRILSEQPDFPVALVWANQGEAESGVHRNISGMGVTAAALNRDNAVQLIEWMATTGQAADETGIPGGNFEFPVNPTAEVNPVIAAWGEFTIDPLPLTDYGDQQEAAVALLERVGYGF